MDREPGGRVQWLGRIGYEAALELQEATRARVLAGEPGAERVFLLEHDPVITLGRGADPGHVLAAGDVPVVRCSRGGDVTYHGPGQLVVYPVVKLRRGIVAFLEATAAALAEVAAELGAPGAAWRRDCAGLWVGGAKLAACGIHVRRGVAIHGWALNVTTPPEAWSRIVPCGLSGVPVTSIAELAGRAPSVAEVAALAADRLCHAAQLG